MIICVLIPNVMKIENIDKSNGINNIHKFLVTNLNIITVNIYNSTI